MKTNKNIEQNPLWTEAEVDALKVLFKACKSKDELVKRFTKKYTRHTERGVYNKCKRLGLLYGPIRKWDSTKKGVLMAAFNSAKATTRYGKIHEAAAAIGDSYGAAEKQIRFAEENGDTERTTVGTGKPWTDEEVDALIRLTMEGKTRSYIHRFALPDRPTNAIAAKQVTLGIMPKDVQSEEDDKWEAFSIADDRILDAIERVSDAVEPLKDPPKEIFKHIKTDRDWIGVVISGDWHIGNATTHFKNLRRDIDVIASTPDLYYGFNGDGVENFTATSIASGMYEQIISPRGARIAMGRLFAILKDKMIAAVLGCHDEFAVRSSDFNLVETLSVDLKIPYLGAGGTINLVLNDNVAYRIAMRHKWRFNSGASPSNTCRKYITEQDPTADVVAVAHNHTSYIGQEDIYSKPRVLIRTGGYKPIDRFSDKLGYAESTCWVPVVLFNTRTKGMRICVSVQEAVDRLAHLNNGR